MFDEWVGAGVYQGVERVEGLAWVVVDFEQFDSAEKCVSVVNEFG